MNQDVFVSIEHLRGQVTDLSYGMLAAARQVAAEAGGEVVAVLLGHTGQHLAQGLAADRVLSIDHPALADFTSEAYIQAWSYLLREYNPRLALFGDTSIGADVAGGLSIRMGLPLVSACQVLLVENGELLFRSQICGGKIMAQGKLPPTTALVTMVPGGYRAEEARGEGHSEIISLEAPPLEDLPVRLKEYIEPEISDVDITKENVLVAVGRGIQNQDGIELVQELAEVLGGVVCASRPVIDQGWLPITRLVGKSGGQVKPVVYLALGISGAPEHVEGIVDSQVIIAVNTDPAAPIFNVAKYGLTCDLFDLVPILVDKIRLSRSIQV